MEKSKSQKKNSDKKQSKNKKNKDKSDGGKKRILMIAAMPFYSEKGSSLRVNSMISKYTKKGYFVDLVCYSSGKSTSHKNLRIYRAGGAYSNTPGPSFSKIFKDTFIFFKALKLIKKNKYDIIQGEDVEGAFLGVILSKISGYEHIYDLHNPFSEGLKLYKWNLLLPIAKIAEKFLYKNSKKVISNWTIWERYLKRNGAKKVLTIRDEIPNETKKVKIPLKKYIAYAGNLEKYQGVKLLINAFAKTIKEHNFSLVIVGSGKGEKEIRELVKRMGIKDRVYFMGRKSTEETTYILKESSLNIIPRIGGRQPSMKLIHYVKAGRPILATGIECNQELKQLTKNVEFYKPNVESLSQGINSMIKK